MENPALFSAISKLAIAGETAGFTVEQMIRILNNGFRVEKLVSPVYKNKVRTRCNGANM